MNANRILCLGVVFLLFSSSVAVAASDATLTATPNTPDSKATHIATILVGNSSAETSLNRVQISYPDSNASSVTSASLLTVGIDKKGDEQGDVVDISLSEDVTSVDVSEDGQTVTVEFSGKYTLENGDEIVIKYSDVKNPSEVGMHRVTIDINSQSKGGEAVALLEILADEDSYTPTENESSTPGNGTILTPNTKTQTPLPDHTAQPGTPPNDTQSVTPFPTSQTDGQAGFGFLVAILALLFSAVLAYRRN